jgi:hypothetical protein
VEVSLEGSAGLDSVLVIKADIERDIVLDVNSDVEVVVGPRDVEVEQLVDTELEVIFDVNLEPELEKFPPGDDAGSSDKDNDVVLDVIFEPDWVEPTSLEEVIVIFENGKELPDEIIIVVLIITITVDGVLRTASFNCVASRRCSTELSSELDDVAGSKELVGVVKIVIVDRFDTVLP